MIEISTAAGRENLTTTPTTLSSTPKRPPPRRVAPIPTTTNTPTPDINPTSLATRIPTRTSSTKSGTLPASLRPKQPSQENKKYQHASDLILWPNGTTWTTIDQCRSRIRAYCTANKDPYPALEAAKYLLTTVDPSFDTHDTSLYEEALRSLLLSSQPRQPKHTILPQDNSDSGRQYVAELPQCIFHPHHPPPAYAKQQPTHMDTEAMWFRNHFIGKPYYTLLRRRPPAVISVVQDTSEGTTIHDSAQQRYRVICRVAQPPDQQRRVVTSHSSVHATNMRDAVAVACPGLVLDDFESMSVESTAQSGIEKELLMLDEMSVPKHYKFGVLSVHEGQTTEQAWFSNTQMDPDLERLLYILGQRVELKGYKGYAAGLDTRAGESGVISFASQWQRHEVMFHVAPLMPLRENDAQQVHRKRHIGNDIVCIVFVKGNAKFDPSKIRSQFLHVFVVIQAVDGKDLWSVEVVRNTNVPDFGPTIPQPGQLRSEQLRDFLLLKMVNGNCAALKSEKFAVPNAKARAGIMTTIIGLAPPPPAPEKHAHHSLDPHPGSNPHQAPPRWLTSIDLRPTATKSSMLLNFTRRRRRNSGSTSVIHEEHENGKNKK
ncbi:hypothetical protein BX666DRAFT_1916621 [Dichotomocladium elegans]|nr:hypothetical protein BX666DRAFT_1916621 [Dichotomocladium elegans]